MKSNNLKTKINGKEYALAIRTYKIQLMIIEISEVDKKFEAGEILYEDRVRLLKDFVRTSAKCYDFEHLSLPEIDLGKLESAVISIIGAYKREITMAKLKAIKIPDTDLKSKKKNKKKNVKK